ncbi:MAG: hypothetical protein JXB50_10750 [Spirochaetes bacterium]|nr:hypothetical protein [Spirochaetota bacterium]
MQFHPLEMGIEVSGRAVYSTLVGLNNLRLPKEKDLLGFTNSETGIIALDLDKWYSQEIWLKVFEMIAVMYGDAILFKIGFAIPDNAEFPILPESMENAIKTIDVAYHLNHKKNGEIMYDKDTGNMQEGIGHYGCKKIEGYNLIIAECTNPYPCSFDKGILTAMAKKIKGNAIAIHDESKPCRKNGAESCTYIISW